jgi:SAM-dependent methyltransferase
MSDAFRSIYYLRHNARRLEHLASLGLDLWDKTVLEVGAGIGDLTSFFLDRGCSVTSVEARRENVKLFVETFNAFRYQTSVKVRLINSDVESLSQHVPETFDIVFCYGLLYHTADPALVLRLLADRAADLLLLETWVSVGTTEAINPIAEDVELASQSFHGGGCRPTRPWLFGRLKALFPFVYVPATQPSHEEFPIDWTIPPTHQATRAVFVASRRPLDLPLLRDDLPDRQPRRAAAPPR